jgi:transcription antitermination factor NusG
MIKTKFKKDFVTLNDVLTFIKSDEWGPNYEKVIIAALKDRRKSEAKEVKSQVKVGSTVGVSGKFEYWLGTVEKVMKTRCAVKNMNNGMRYAVPMNLIDVKPSVFA